MSWTYGHRTLPGVIERLTAPHQSPEGNRKTLAHALTRDSDGNVVLWQAVKLDAKTDGYTPDLLKAGESRTVIGCDLLAHRQGGYVYKEMDENDGLMLYGCPLSILNLVNGPRTVEAARWREDARRYHETHHAVSFTAYVPAE